MRLFFLLLFSPLLSFSQHQVIFTDYFVDQTLRVDYYHTGDAKNEFFSLDKIYRQGSWAGNPDACIQPVDLGVYLLKVIDTLSGKVIYTKGFNSIFAEYQTIGEALNGVIKTYHESVLIPCPIKPVKLVLEKRDKKNIPAPVYSLLIDPADYHINNESVNHRDDEVIIAVKNGDPHKSVDLVILGEGYTQEEKGKFKTDLEYYSKLLLNFEPYKKYARFFNIYGIFSPSNESGTDEPRQKIYKNTRFNTTFNYFDVDRYCLADDNKSIRDVAAAVPYDAILIMVNRDRYGGGGIYNWQVVFNTGSLKRDYVFLHEFGHAFAGLADEYYNSTVAYVDIYTPDVEPLEPNITTLADTAHLKWKQYLSPGIKVPTEWGKVIFDSLNLVLKSTFEQENKMMDEMKKRKASETEIQLKRSSFEAQINKLQTEIDNFIFHHPLKDKVGVFEGANYLSKGYYRPTINSMMQKFDPSNPTYGVVNELAIIRTIEYYTK